MPVDFIKNYFTQEKIESLFFIFIGIVAISFSLINWFIIKYSFYKGLAYPLLIIGIIQLSVGTVVFIRTPEDIARVEHIVKAERSKINTEELPRMKKVIQNFTIYKWIELALILVGISLFFLCKNSNVRFWKGLGLGLMIQASLMLTIDTVAENRAAVYVNCFQAF